jgi:hypothetical protein
LSPEDLTTSFEAYATLAQQGVVLREEEGALKARRRQGTLTDAQRALIRDHKAGLIAFLSAKTQRGAPANTDTPRLGRLAATP